jgi:squalene-hopene/tetraprenyl-beta-curcumene cyclase
MTAQPHAASHRPAAAARGPAAQAAIRAAAGALFTLQRPDGSWQGTLPSSAVSTGAAVVALWVADHAGSAPLAHRGVAWIRDAQRGDGGWGDAADGPSTMNATALAVAALQLIEPEPSAAQVRRGLEWITAHGGQAALEDRRRCTLGAICRQFLALAGLYDPRQLARMPLELALLPAPLRSKLSFTVPGIMAWGIMQSRTWPFRPARRLVNRLAEPRALRYLQDIQAYEDYRGGFEESPLMTAVVYFGLARAAVRADITGRCREYLHSTVRPDGSWAIDRDIEFSVTMYIAQAFSETAFAGHPRLAPIPGWVRGRQRLQPFRPTNCPAGGWGWSMPSGWPDTDDTAGAVTVLAAAGGAAGEPVRRGTAWLEKMQNRDGSWGCFTRDNPVSMDGPCAVMTAHAVTALAAAFPGPAAASRPAVRRAIRWFARAQRDDGSLPSLWFRESVAGTARSLDALARVGHGASPAALRAAGWLVRQQDASGGWGDGRGTPPTAEETAWSVLGLLAVPGSPREATQAGADWLIRHQRADGLWQPAQLALYFNGLTYWCDHIANGYALAALGRFHRLEASRGRAL